jgi:D-alanyl-D-alanine carboxypeptidase
MQTVNINKTLNEYLIKHLKTITTMLFIAVFALAQAATSATAQTRTGRQTTETTPPKKNQIDDLKNPGVNIDFERLSQDIALGLQNKTVGYGFAVFHNGQLIKRGGGGFARRQPDTSANAQIPFTEYSRVDIASTTKTMTSIAVLKALESKGKDDSELIYKYLPTNWNIPASVKKLTFRDVLSHHSGLRKVTDGSYDGVRRTIEAGVAADYEIVNYDQSDDEYQNINFVTMRVVLAYLVNAPLMVLYQNDPAKSAELTAQTYCQFVRDNVFKAAAINKQVSFKPWDESGDLTKVPLLYNEDSSNLAGIMAGDHTLDGGAGGLFINAVEMAQVLAALENGVLLSDNTRMMMKQHDLGIFQVDNTAFYTHNGGFSDSQGRGSSTRLVLCPNNIQVAIVINSSNNDTDSTFSIVKNAIDNAVSKK